MSHNFAHCGQVEKSSLKENETSNGKLKLSFWFKPTSGAKLFCLAYGNVAINLKWQLDKEQIYINGFVNENKENIVTSISVEDKNEKKKVVDSISKLYGSDSAMQEARREEAVHMNKKGLVKLLKKLPCGLYGYSYIPEQSARFYEKDTNFIVIYPK